MPVVYIASPYRGHVDRNRAYAMRAMADSLTRGEAPFVPHLLYTLVLDDAIEVEREAGMRAGAAMMARCDMLVAYADYGVSTGMEAEIRLARAQGLDVLDRRIGRSEPDPVMPSRLHEIAREVATAAASWDPEARLIANVKASDLMALSMAFADREIAGRR